MNAYESLKHTSWECKYHGVFIPKYRKKVLYRELRRELGRVFRELAQQQESEIVEGHLMPDHVHMLISIPPKHSLSAVMGFVKARVPYTSCECMPDGDGISLGNTFGRGGIGSRRSDETRQQCADISRSKRRKTGDWNRWSWAALGAPHDNIQPL